MNRSAHINPKVPLGAREYRVAPAAAGREIPDSFLTARGSVMRLVRKAKRDSLAALRPRCRDKRRRTGSHATA